MDGCHFERLLTARTTVWALLAFVTLAVTGGCTSIRDKMAKKMEPSNLRNWKPTQAVLATAERDGDQVTVHNIRRCTYFSEDDYVVFHYDKQYDLRDLERLDFVVVPFAGMPSLAHTMLSFGFSDDRYLGVSVEVRLEEGESYSPIAGAMREFEIIYVVADERDLIPLRTRIRNDQVYVYPVRADPEQVQALFLDIMNRVNALAAQPEFYNTLTNNCTTNIVDHINRLHPGRVPYDLSILLPGRSDNYAFKLGLLAGEGSFERLKRKAHINRLAEQFADSPDFSTRIRR